LQPRLLERLYESDAKGLRDTDLCADVGLRLYDRCRSFVLVQRNEVECPLCRQVFVVSSKGKSHCSGESCSWSTTDRIYRESIQKYYAHSGRAIDAFAAFHRRFPSARAYADQILLIDQLIHSFHVDEKTQLPAKSIASKLLEGNKNEVLRFLDRLSARDPDQKERWRRSLAQTIHEHLLSPRSRT
jgi:hypothetical protein